MRRIRLLPLVVAVFAIFAPAFTSYASTNIVTNGTFSSDGGGWNGANGGADCSSGLPSLGLWANNRLTFSYNENTVSQSIIIQTPSELLFSISVDFPWGGNYSVSISDSNEFLTTGQINVPDWNSPSTSHSFLITTTQQSEVVTISISGRDNMWWAGCYGPQFSNATLFETIPATTTTLNTNNSSYSINENMIWGIADEGWNLPISAPGGGIFSRVVFASYGNPSGLNGDYVQGSCHATNSIEKVSEFFIGKSSASIDASNGVFGDPCGGTYKRLYVVLEYTGGLPNTSTTTTTLPPTCGPYDNITVTGKLNGSVWGSGPYTDDSDMGVAAVHAGLINVGETATLIPTNISYYLSYPGSYTNGVETSDWLSGWCGYDISLLNPITTTVPAPNTTIPEETTTTIMETTTTQEQTTTTSEVISETTTSTMVSIPTIENTTTTTTNVISTSTTQPKEQGGTQSTESTETTVSKPAPDAQDEAPTNTNNEVTVNNLSDVISNDITPDVASKLINVIKSGDATDEQIVAVVTALIQAGQINSDAATELATSPDVLQSISSDQAGGIFSAIEVSELSNEVAAQLVAAVQDAPKEVRQAFESEINVFAGSFDTYTPIGSKIDVGTRRVVVAASAAMFAAPAPSSNSSSSDSGRTRRRS